MDTTALWQGDFGDEYHRRNRVEWRKRIKFWTEIYELTGFRSAYEFGCGPGWNLSAIQRVDPLIKVYGSDINTDAVDQAVGAGLEVNVGDDSGLFPYEPVELAFSCGSLIHVPPGALKYEMEALIDASTDYVMAIEYENETEKMIPYRGQDDALWARPYGQLYQDLGLKLMMVAGAGEGFDNCTAWLLRK